MGVFKYSAKSAAVWLVLTEEIDGKYTGRFIELSGKRHTFLLLDIGNGLCRFGCLYFFGFIKPIGMFC